MLKIAHRINTLADLALVPLDWGVEIDVRQDNRSHRLYLNHNIGTGEDLETYLTHFKHRFLIFNIKESGIEQTCIDLAATYGIQKEQYFLLDVEFPYLYRASRQQNIHEIAIRFSEAEPIELAEAQRGFVNWIWIDTNTILPINTDTLVHFRGFKTCLVSPDRWNRPDDISKYRGLLKKLNFEPDAVMVDLTYGDLWTS